MWTRNAQQILGLERHGDFGWHAVLPGATHEMGWWDLTV
jgi:hypothetical protein